MDGGSTAALEWRVLDTVYWLHVSPFPIGTSVLLPLPPFRADEDAMPSNPLFLMSIHPGWMRFGLRLRTSGIRAMLRQQ